MDNDQDSGLFSHLLQQNPLALGFIALVLGALIGALIPETSQENDLMGATRDQFADKTQGAVEDLAHKVGVVAGAAQTAAHDALGKAQDAAKDAAKQAFDQVKEEAKHQGLVPEA